MAQKRTHTHTGHCQACGRIQAVDVKKATIAKHGYTTTYGFFNGTCPGSDHKALELDFTFCEAIQKMLNKDAKNLDEYVAGLKISIITPKTVAACEHKYGGTYVSEIHIPNPKFIDSWQKPRQMRSIVKMVAWAEADELSRKHGVEKEISESEAHAKQMRSHVKDLKKLVKDFFGQPLIPVEIKKTAAIGLTFKLYGAEWEIVGFKDVNRGWRSTENVVAKKLSNGYVGNFAKATVTKALNA